VVNVEVHPTVAAEIGPRSRERVPRAPGEASGSFQPDGLSHPTATVLHDATRYRREPRADGRPRPAHTIGDDPETDLEVLGSMRTGVQAVPLETPAKLRRARWRSRLETRMDFQSTVTAGVVSATRSLSLRSYAGLD